MSCIVNTVNFCFIEQESKILPLLFFEENVQADGFKYILKGKYNNLEYTFEVADGQGDGIGFVNDTTVQIKANFETLQEGVYTHELTEFNRAVELYKDKQYQQETLQMMSNWILEILSRILQFFKYVISLLSSWACRSLMEINFAAKDFDKLSLTFELIVFSRFNSSLIL